MSSEMLLNIIGRMSGKKNKELREAQKELEQSISLVKAPAALIEDASHLQPIKLKASQPQTDDHLMEEWNQKASHCSILYTII